MSRVAGTCARITESRPFEVLIVVVIGANAVVVLLSEEPCPTSSSRGLAVSPWTLVPYVVNSMEEVRRLEMTEGLAPDHDIDGDGVPDETGRGATATPLPWATGLGCC